MKLTILLLICILTSCVENKKNNEALTEEVEIIEVLENTATPTIEDNSFYDFIFKFMTNKEFQLSRTKINNWEYKNHFYNKAFTLHFFNSFEIPKDEFKKDLEKEKYMTVLDFKTKKKTELNFKKIEDIWYLNEQNLSDFNTANKSDFETFLFHFSTDKAYMKQHIKSPLKSTYLDYDNNFEEISEFTYEDRDFNVDFFDNKKIMFFHNKKYSNSKQIQISLRGLEFGAHVYYCFEKSAEKWELIEIKDFSN